MMIPENLKGGSKMSEEINEPKSRKNMVWVKDKAGNEFVCDASSLKDPKNVSQDELKDCVDDATSVQPFAGG